MNIHKWKNFSDRVLLHIVTVLLVFVAVRDIVIHFKIHDNWIWFRYGASLLISFAKETYDELSRDGSGFDSYTLVKELAIPTIWIVVYYLKYM